MCRYALMREVADFKVGKFPRSMSDFKPGDKNLRCSHLIATKTPNVCPGSVVTQNLVHSGPDFLMGAKETRGTM